ncbi:zinc finger CCCH domain-containing protein 15 homolog isoform X2 [Nilaparvata lugens]|uniref:zinc finger CCCH domain-containing protein 15 homolog isoform X2 n=1 Tax=Nilaparvata lugens TaxID=108931 RepID=UPI00193CDF1B|nr:zinc finger CCCH domain-containing protein 15 homolog isoform X2 [Nilaparvata lugens]
MDKTFGLKNKKGAKQQRFIQQVEKQVKSGGVPPRKQNEDPKAKDSKAKEQKELAMLFRPVQKVEKGADPKSIVCAFFKEGQCTKGSKCKFSHDLTVERKAEKRSMYVDMRDGEDENDTMENWDEEKLKEVVEKKHGESEAKTKPTTDIICKFFLDAVEKNKYGWFWSCPNGENCIYRHALPPGFVLKKDKKKEEKKDEISLEDLIEKERAALGSQKFTKITLETFVAWKKRKLREKKEAAAKEEEKRRSDFKAGRQVGLSGREMFCFNPELASGDMYEDGDEAFDSYKRNDDEDSVDPNEYREIQLDQLEMEASEVDNTGTIAPDNRLTDIAPATVNGQTTSPETLSSEEAAAGGAAAVSINEHLFTEDDLEDLEEELDDLDIDQ